MISDISEAGLSDACPDMAKAVNTWRFAITTLKKAAEPKLDAGTMQYVTQIEAGPAKMFEDLWKREFHML